MNDFRLRKFISSLFLCVAGVGAVCLALLIATAAYRAGQEILHAPSVALAQGQFNCPNSTVFNLAAGGNTQILAATAGNMQICHISFSTTAAEDVKLTVGSGANCGTGTADATGLYKSVQSMALDFGYWGAVQNGVGQAFCLNQSAAQALGGVVIWGRVQ